MKGNVNKKVKEILRIASKEAKYYNNRKLKPSHILLAILLDNTNICISLLNELDVNIDDVFEEVSDYLNSESLSPVVSNSIKTVPPNSECKELLNGAIKISNDLGLNEVGLEHVLLSMLYFDNKTKTILNNNKLTYNKLISKIKGENMENNKLDKMKSSNTSTPILNSFCVDITKLAEAGKIDPVIGRDKEIKRMSQILARRKKQNPLLIGAAGVGKSSVVDGLARLIHSEDCPTSLANKKIYNLDVSSVIAGTKYRGEFESRMKLIITELTENKDIILFIDEIHTIVGAGSSSDSLDVSNILKPALSRGDLQVIGATTLDEFRESIEKDGALTRRFQTILVNEPNLIETKNILDNIKTNYEKYHRVEYSEEAIVECVKMSDRYITDRAMPDKAIDIMDECGAMTNTDIKKPDKIIELENRKLKIDKEKEIVVNQQKYEDAAKLKIEEGKIDEQIETLNTKWLDSLNEKRTIITPEMVASVVSLISGIPLTKLSSEDNKKLMNMEKTIKKKVIGQDEAVTKISKAIRRNKLGLGNKNKPQGSFICMGISGVGKTHLAKVVSEYIFNDSEALIRFDMSEYMEKFNVSKLIGSPPGYVGYEEGGKLTEAVRRKPYSVILFDEIEKAHPDVFNILLQVLDEGFLTDSVGRKVNFKNTLIIMTSNVGVKELSQHGKNLGFETKNNVNNNKKRTEDILSKAVKGKFTPEFLNRLDDIIVFNQLKKEDIHKIVNIELTNLIKDLKEIGYEIKFNKRAIEYIGDKGYNEEYGARPLGRVIQTLIQDRIAEDIISGNILKDTKIKVGYSSKDDELTFKY